MNSKENIKDLQVELLKEKKGVQKVQKDPEHVILLGKGQGWQQCPPNGEIIYHRRNPDGSVTDEQVNAEIWGLNGLLFEKKKLDRIFMMDIIDEMPSVVAGYWEIPKVIDKLNELGIPMVAPYQYAEISNSESFPIKEVVEMFGTPYLNNTIAYMIAYALMKGVKSISTWGINQASGSEYFYEKGCVEYWVGQALGRGVDVYINGPSELLLNKARYGGTLLYGYNTTYEGLIKHHYRFGEKTVHKLMAPKDFKMPRNAGLYNKRKLALDMLQKSLKMEEDGGGVNHPHREKVEQQQK